MQAATCLGALAAARRLPCSAIATRIWICCGFMAIRKTYTSRYFKSFHNRDASPNVLQTQREPNMTENDLCSNWRRQRYRR